MKPATPHDPIDDLIAAALHGDLTPEERTQFESRLQTDPNAQAAYQEAQVMHDLLEQTNRSAQPDPDFEQRMVSGVRRKIANPPHQETAWESLLALWSGTKRVFAIRKMPSSVWRYGVNVVVLLGIIAILAGVALGPITNGIKKAKQSSELQMGHAIAMADYEAQADAGDPNPVPMGVEYRPSEGRPEDGRILEVGEVNGAKKEIDITERVKEFAKTGVLPVAKDKTALPSTMSGSATLADLDAQKVAISAGGTTTVAMDSSATDSNAFPSLATSTAPIVTQSVAENAPFAPAMPDSAPIGAAAAPAPASTFAPTTPSQTHAIFAMNDLKQAEQQKAERQPRAAAVDTAMASLEKGKLPVDAPPATPAPVDSRKLIRNAQLDLEVKSYQAAFDQVTALTRAAGGYVDTSNSQRGGNGKLQGIVVVKILPENLDAFLLKLRDLGEVQNQSVSTDDVTKEYFDTQARLVNSQKMELQLQDLLKRENGKVSDLLAVERELGRVRGEIEQMQGQLKLYDFQVQYATVTMNVAEKDLNQTAAYLLKEQDDFALFATDVETTFQKARTAADDFKTQVLVANLRHNSGTDVSAELTVMVPPDQVEHFLTTIRGLGRVANFTRQTQRVAKDGGDSSQPADQTRTDKDKVQVHLIIRSDDDTRKQVAIVIVAKQVDDALDMAKTATLASTGAEILGSALSTTPDGISKAQLSVRVPGKEYTTLMDAFRALGRQASLNVQRNDSSGPGATGDDVPVIVSLSLTDQEVPVQATNLVLVTPNVDELSQQIKKDAAAAGVEVKASNFGGQPNGSHLARLTLMLPMGKYAAYVETLKKLGRVQSLSVQRNDTSGNAADDAPAEIALALTDDDPPVQVTQVTLLTNDVDTQAQQIKKQAGDAGVDIKSSSFERQPDGTELAQMTLRLPLGHYPAFLATLQQAGKTESLSVQRDDHPEQARPDDSAPAEIQLQLHNTAAIVPDNSGLWATLRDTFSQGFAALFGSVKVIGVIVAFLIPWVVALVALAWIGRRIYVWRKNR